MGIIGELLIRIEEKFCRSTMLTLIIIRDKCGEILRPQEDEAWDIMCFAGSNPMFNLVIPESRV